MKNILLDLKNKNLINVDENEVLLEHFGKHKNLITNWTRKNLGQQVPKKYGPYQTMIILLAKIIIFTVIFLKK